VPRVIAAGETVERPAGPIIAGVAPRTDERPQRVLIRTRSCSGSGRWTGSGGTSAKQPEQRAIKSLAGEWLKGYPSRTSKPFEISERRWT